MKMNKSNAYLLPFFTCLLLYSNALSAQFSDAFSEKLVSDHQFDYAIPTDNGLYKVRLHGKHSFVDSTGKIAPGWRWYDRIENFWEGIAPVQLKGRWGICNAAGELTIPLEMDSVRLGYRNQTVWFKENGMWGMANGASGKVLIPAEWEKYYYASYASPVLWSVERNGQSGLVDNYGQWLTRPIYQWIGGYYQSNVPYLSYMLAGRIGFMDTTGREVIEPVLDYDMVNFELTFAKNKLWASKGGRWGLLHSNGHWLIPPKFIETSGRSNTGAWVNTEPGLWGYIDTSGNFLVAPMPLDRPWQRFSNGVAVVYQYGKNGVLGIDGKWKIPPRPEIIKYKINKIWAIELPDLKLACLDEHGNAIMQGNNIYAPGDGYLYLERKGIWTFINSAGEWIRKPELEAIRGFNDEGAALAQKKGKWGLLSNTGTWLIPPQYDDAYSDTYRIFNDSTRSTVRYTTPVMLVDGEEVDVVKKPGHLLYWFKKGKTWHLTDTSGVLYPKIAMDSAYRISYLCDYFFAIANRVEYHYNNLYRIYKPDGTPLSEIWFEEVRAPSNGCLNFSVRQNRKWGIMDKNGGFEFPCISSSEIKRSDVRDGRTIVDCYGESFYVNNKWQLGVIYEKK